MWGDLEEGTAGEDSTLATSTPGQREELGPGQWRVGGWEGEVSPDWLASMGLEEKERGEDRQPPELWSPYRR